MTTSEDRTSNAEDAVEQLLKLAEPRPMPSPEGLARARQSIEAEWSRSIRRRNLGKIALAASLMLAAFVWFVATSVIPTRPVAVASIDKVIGDIAFLGDNGVVIPGEGRTTVMSGETISTRTDAGLGLNWHSGGSLRLDAATTVRFHTSDRIELLRGRVYFDSGANSSRAGTLVIGTQLGDVRHVGTQYMADIRNPDFLRISVREGEVEVIGVHHEIRIGRGEQVALQGDRLPAVSDLATYSNEWQWVQFVAPVIELEGKNFYELLQWASREAGLNYRFASIAAEEAAKEPLVGVQSGEPMSTLRVGAAAAQLALDQQGGEILITIRDR